MRRLRVLREGVDMPARAEDHGRRARGGLAHIRVHDAMHRGILSCEADSPLADVAAMMAGHRVHAVAVRDVQGMRPIGIVSDVDLIAAIRSGEQPIARQIAGTEPLTVSEDERIDRAAQMMTEYGVSHLVVLDAASGYPTGVLSTLDIAAVYARETA
jgi:CBS domain-containing protein